jgi:hypothetical protein
MIKIIILLFNFNFDSEAISKNKITLQYASILFIITAINTKQHLVITDQASKHVLH